MDKVTRLQNTQHIREIMILKHKITIVMTYNTIFYFQFSNIKDVEEHLEIFKQANYWFDAVKIQADYDGKLKAIYNAKKLADKELRLKKKVESDKLKEEKRLLKLKNKKK